MAVVPSYRSLLFVPGHQPDWVPKALRARPDAIILDLEDAVPESAKETARNALTDGVRSIRQASTDSSADVGVVVRVNAWATDHAPADLEAAVAAGPDHVLAPKVETVTDLVQLDAVLSFLERRAGVDDGSTGVIVSLETPAALQSAAALAAAPRVVACLTAAAKDGDTARSVGFQWTAQGFETLAWRTSAVLACRAAGVHPIIGLWQEVRDLEGLSAFAAANRAIGYGGQIVIHPSHIGPVNAAFSPTEAELDYYERLLAAVDEAARQGRGAVIHDGDHVDAAHVATARAVIARARSAG